VRGLLAYRLDLDSDHGSNDELGDAITVVNGDWVIAEVDQQHLNLAPVILVDGARRVENRHTVARGQAGARPHLPLVSEW
jgi:hypothetical protein